MAFATSSYNKHQCKINGKIYSSLREASDDLGMSYQTIGRELGLLRKSSLSSREREIKVSRTFLFEKIKDAGEQKRKS